MRTLSQLSRQEIKDITIQYSRTNYVLAANYFSKEYNISAATFYSAIEKAVIEHIVDIDVVNLVKKKAIQNAYAHANTSADAARKRVINHYNELIRKRNQFVFRKSKIIVLTNRYLSMDSNFTIDDFCATEYIDYELFVKTIAICSLKYVNNNTFNLIIDKFTSTVPEYSKKKITDILMDCRLNYKNKEEVLVNNIYKKIIEVYY